ncbi:MAG: tRNA (adenosine(37)-N6)-threonylcarbamoyltransferase complex ATPase subunit type 1 TsaE [Chthoniobacterales bacterium]
MEKICKTVEETMAAGQTMAASLSAGSVLSLEGELGAGKTHFVKGLAAGLGVNDVISSPTFTIVHEYSSGTPPLCHVDFYRMESPEEALGIGLEEYFDGWVTVIEWGNRFPGLLPSHTQRIKFEILPSGERRLKFSGK